MDSSSKCTRLFLYTNKPPVHALISDDAANIREIAFNLMVMGIMQDNNERQQGTKPLIEREAVTCQMQALLKALLIS